MVPRLSLGGLIAFCLLGVWSSRAQSVPAFTNYQGRLVDANGVNAPDGSGYEIEVRMWSAPVDGDLIWGARYSGVQVRNGVYSLILGAPGGESLPQAQTNELTSAFEDPNRYIGVTVSKGASGILVLESTEILPRQQIMTAPFAFKANQSKNSAHAAIASSVENNGVTTTAIKNGAITPEKLAENTITGASIVDNTITGQDIAPSTIPPSRIALDLGVFVEKRPSGELPQLPTLGWQRRILNSTEFRTGDSTILSDNKILLQPGIYEIEAICSIISQAAIRSVAAGGVYFHSVHRTAIRFSEDDTPLILSTVNSSNGTRLPVGLSGTPGRLAPSEVTLKGFIKVEQSPRAIELWHYISPAHDAIRLISEPIVTFESIDRSLLIGFPSGIPNIPEIYTRVIVRRVQ